MALVPGQYIKDLPVDYEGEIFAFMSVPATLGGAEIPPPTLGSWSLFEVADLKWTNGQAPPDFWGFLRAAHILAVREKAAPLVRDWLAAGLKGDAPPLDSPPKCAWDAAAVTWAEASKLEFTPESVESLGDALALSFSGFAMLPKEPVNGLWLFGAETMQGVARTLCENLNCSFFEALWRVPLCVAGHVCAGIVKGQGRCHVGRPKDPADIKIKLDAARAREDAGELHPWQILDPKWNPPTARQKEANPGILVEMESWKNRIAVEGAAVIEEELRGKGMIDV